MDDMTLLQAIAFARSRGVLLPADYYSLDMNSRQYASTVSNLAGIDQIQSVLDSAYKVLENGGTFRDFQDLVAQNGIDLSESHLDNVFRTNIQNAYAHGKWLHQQQNKAKRPYLEYFAINDKRARPSHLALDSVIRHIDDPFWQKWYPPNGYRCRCTTNAITEKQAIRKGITSNEDLPNVQPDSGWAFQPSNYDKQPDEILKSKEASKTTSPEAKAEVVDLRKKTLVDLEADHQIKKSFSDLTDEKQVIIDEMVDKTVKLNPDIRPSDLRIALDLSDEKDNALTDLLKISEVQKEQAGTIGKSIWDRILGAFNRLFSIAKNTASKLTGNSIRGLDGLNLSGGSVIGIQTPTLFKQAEKIGKQITIIDAKGIAIDLNKISGLSGSLLAADLNFEVISNTDDLLILQKTEKQATRYFVANQNAFSLY